MASNMAAMTPDPCLMRIGDLPFAADVRAMACDILLR